MPQSVACCQIWKAEVGAMCLSFPLATSGVVLGSLYNNCSRDLHPSPARRVSRRQDPSRCDMILKSGNCGSGFPEASLWLYSSRDWPGSSSLGVVLAAIPENSVETLDLQPFSHICKVSDTC